MTKSKKKQRRWILAFLILFGAGFLLLYFFIPRIITDIRNPIFAVLRNNQEESASTNFEENSSKGKYLNFITTDGLKLTSYLTYSSRDTTFGTIILVHGIRSYKEHFIELSEYLSEQGFNSVAIDLRAHGQSEGTHCTFGVKEKEDISTLIDTLEKQEGISQCIGIWGQSLGGAIALQAMGSDKRIQYGIIESTFSDLNSITNDYFKNKIGFSFKIFTDYLVYRAGKIAEFDPQEASPLLYCSKIEQPILLIHGNQDKRINIKYAKANFSQIKSPKKELCIIEGANHLNVWQIGGIQYFDKIISFIKSNANN